MNIPVSEISRRLADQAERICQHLLPGGKLFKNEWLAGDINGGEGDSLKVHVTGNYAGNWKDWSNPADHGDLLDLWRLTRNLSPGDAVKEAKAWLGITDTVFREPKNYQKPPAKEQTPPNPKGKAFTWLTEERKLTQETLDAFKITTESRAIVFPCYSPGGDLVNRSYRNLPPPGEKKRVWQDTGCAPCLFGWQAFSQDAYRSRRVVIAEGQIDAMTWHQWGIPALSVPAGTGMPWIDYEWDNLALFDRIYISFDMDGAGRDTAEKVIARLGIHRCMVVKIPRKDANDCLKAGHTAEDAAGFLRDSSAPPLKGLVTAMEMIERLKAELAPKPMPFTLRMFALGWPYSGLYFRPGEVTLWTGASHHGKSTFLNFFVMSALAAAQPVFVASLEVRVETTLRRMASAAFAMMGMPRAPGPDDAATFLMEFGEHLSFADVVGYIGMDRLIEMMRYAFQRFGSLHFIVDSLMRIEGLEEDYPAQGVFMNRLQEFVKETGTHVHLVAHPRKLGPNGKPAMMDIKGSSLVPNNADNIVAVVRNMEKMQAAKEGNMDPEMAARYDTEIIVEKQRESGWIGSFPMKFDSRTLIYTPHNK